jgi:hypothetical protein
MNRLALRSRPLRYFAIAAATCLVVHGADGAIVTLFPSKDNTLYESVTGDESNGLGEFLFAGRTGPRNNLLIRRATLAFDLAAVIPANATIMDVTLTLFLSQAGANAGGTIASLYALTTSWGEGTSMGNAGNPAPATIGDATWLHRFYNTSLWSDPGGDFDPQQSADTAIGSASQPYVWSGAGLVADVQEWVASPASNFGWVLRGEEGDTTTALRFDSRESSIAANRPQLTVTYTVVPEPVSVALLASGLLVVITRWEHARHFRLRAQA